MKKPIQTGERISLTVGYKGGLASRAAFAAYKREDLDSAVRDYEEKIAKPYFAAVCTWLEHLHIGMEGKEVYALVDDILPKDIFCWKLNPGHLTADEEWLSSPIYVGSRLKLKSGMLPLSSMVAYYTPYLMNHDYAFTWKQ